jgi:hypothetical protein
MGSYKHVYRWIAQHVLGNARTEAHVQSLLKHARVVHGRLVPRQKVVPKRIMGKVKGTFKGTGKAKGH